MAKDNFKPRRFRDSGGNPTIQVAPCTFIRDPDPLPDSGYCENCGHDVSGPRPGDPGTAEAFVRSEFDYAMETVEIDEQRDVALRKGAAGWRTLTRSILDGLRGKK